MCWSHLKTKLQDHEGVLVIHWRCSVEKVFLKILHNSQGTLWLTASGIGDQSLLLEDIFKSYEYSQNC